VQSRTWFVREEQHPDGYRVRDPAGDGTGEHVHQELEPDVVGRHVIADGEARAGRDRPAHTSNTGIPALPEWKELSQWNELRQWKELPRDVRRKRCLLVLALRTTLTLRRVPRLEIGRSRFRSRKQRQPEHLVHRGHEREGHVLLYL